LANVVQTADGRASAFDAGMSYRHCRAAGAVYDGMVRTVLSEQLGVVWEERNGQWEVAAVDPQLCQLFSKRRQEIQDCLDEWEQSSGRAAQFAALNTRAAKTDVGNEESLEGRWAAEADEHGLYRQFAREDLSAGLEVVRLSDEQVIEHLVGPARVDGEDVRVRSA
jgi:conjugative relaxase-like TrwC/TraI family protein